MKQNVGLLTHTLGLVVAFAATNSSCRLKKIALSVNSLTATSPRCWDRETFESPMTEPLL